MEFEKDCCAEVQFRCPRAKCKAIDVFVCDLMPIPSLSTFTAPTIYIIDNNKKEKNYHK